MRIETAHPRELGLSEAAQWRAHQGADPSLGSPYFSPAWANMVGAARPDALVCVIGGGKGFFAVQRTSRFAAMGLGAPIADYQGVVGEPGLALTASDLCRALKVGRIDLACVPAGQPVLARGTGGEEGSWIADVSGGAEAYRAHLKKHRGKVARQTDNRLRKLGEDHGEVALAAASGERAGFETLLAWKSAQLERTGQPAIWSAPWVRQVVDATFASQDPSCGGVVFTLKAGGRLVAACYALKSERVLHVWMIGHEEAFDAYSPGVILARWVIEWAGEQGLAEVDFGCGDYQFKRHLSTGQRMVQWGSAARPSWSGAVRGAQLAVRAGVERLENKKIAALPGKAMRRLDVMRGLGDLSLAR